MLTTVSVLLHQAVRTGALHVNQDIAEAYIVAHDSSIVDALAADDLLILSTSIGRGLWRVVQSVLEEQMCELQNAITLVAMSDAKPNEEMQSRKRHARRIVIVIAFSTSSDYFNCTWT